ncbi:unnamed protein product, partial [Closterium sp. NIES-53]
VNFEPIQKVTREQRLSMEGDWSGGGGGGGMRPQAAAAEPDWRTRLPREKRQILVKRIMESLQKFTSAPDMNELHRVAASFEQKIFSMATNQDDYLWRISQKMLYIKSKGHMLQAQAAGGTSSQASAGSVATGGMTADASNMSYPQQQQQQQPGQAGQASQQQQAMRAGGAMMMGQQQQPGAMAPISSITGPGGMGAPVQPGAGMGAPGAVRQLPQSNLSMGGNSQ